ncbi:MAG TPA: IPT/TIG domain-containing protein [Nitrospirales bacterium]
MSITVTGRLVLILALVAFTGSMAGPALAGELTPGKRPVKTDGPGARPGGGIESTKASGANKVAKSQVCKGIVPKIKKVSPDEGKAGDKITITGEHFGEAGCVSGVAFGPGSPAKFTQVNDGMVTAIVPEGTRGIELLSLTNSRGEDSKPFLRK